MNTLWELFIEPLTAVHFQKALIGGSLSAVACGVIGVFIVLRRMAFLGDALSHAMLAGVTAGYLFMQVLFGVEAHTWGMIVGALLAGFATVMAISFVAQTSRIKEDTAIGIMYTGMFALGGILASVFSHRIHLHLYDFIVGNVLAIENGHLWMIAIVCSLVLCVVILFFRQFLISTFDPIMAASIGVPVAAIHYLMTACTSLVVVSAVPVVGVVLVVGLLITPAATAYLLSDRLRYMLVLSPLFGITTVLGGLYVSTWVSVVSTGPMMVLLGTLQFIVVLCVSPRHGLIADAWRRWQLVPQALVEDVLGAIRRDERPAVPMEEIIEAVRSPAPLIHRAIRSLVRRNWLQESATGLRLTESGQHEARRLLRAHRLWESYLDHVGAPSEELHNEAHRLEHLHDEQTVDYLDDKLGHPLRDPHGSDIPEDFVHLVPGETMRASLLREGHRATVEHLEPASALFDLKVGMTLVAGPRHDNEMLWTFVLPDGREIHLHHDAADAVLVRLIGND